MKKKAEFLAVLLIFMFFPKLQWAQEVQKIQWIGFKQLERSLPLKPKKVMIYFYADWCAPCLKMDATAFKDPKVIQLLNSDYYAVKMNVEATDTIVFGNQKFINKRAEKRNPVHEIPLLMASRKDVPFTLPAMVLTDLDFNATARYFQYLDAAQLLGILQN